MTRKQTGSMLGQSNVWVPMVACATFIGVITTVVVTAEEQAEKAPVVDLDRLWADLYGTDPAATRAALQLYQHPNLAVPYLREKLAPLTLDADECRKLLADLDSDDEKDWKPAWEKLDYLDPRLALDLNTLMKEFTEIPVRTRMVELCSQRKADSLDGMDIQIQDIGDEGYNFFVQGYGSWWAEHRIDRIGNDTWNDKKSWTRAARCIAVLKQIGSLEAIEVLDRLAGGHPEAFPTKAAIESLARLKK